MNGQLFIIMGWIGMFLMILAYYLLSKKKLKSNDISYNILNGIAGVGVLMSSIYVKLWPVAVLNIFWILVAIYSLIKITRGVK
jgi:hypothetical protein